MGADESLFIVEDDDPKSGLGSEKSDSFVIDKQTNGYQNGDLEVHVKTADRVRCHTGSIDNLYCMWHGSKYCCRAPEPNRTIEEDIFDDCLNYLECSDVMMDYENDMWQHALLGDEPVFLLEGDQEDETKVIQGCINEYDRLPSDVTCANEGSNNTLSMDALTSLCVSHSQPPRLDVKGEFPGDNLKALQPEMVITVGHQEDNTPSLKRKERCKLPLSTIQDERVGIDKDSVENRLRDVSARINPRTCSPYMELYLRNVLDNSVKGLIKMTEESTEDPLIDDFSKEKEVLDQIDTEDPGTSEPIEECEDGQHSTNDISEDDSLEHEELNLWKHQPAS